MATITLGLGTSHSPQLNLGPDIWPTRAEEDRHNPMLHRVPDGAHVTYEELLESAAPGIEKELGPEILGRRHEANQRGIARVADALAEAAPTFW